MSNIELLRIMAMILIMFGHSHLRIHPFAVGDLSLMSFWESLSACVTTMGVGIFVAISGWFGIRFKVKGLVQYLFQVFFVLWVVYGISIALNITTINIVGIKTCMGLYDGYWFIIGYLGLFLISPILNSFIETTSKSTFRIVLLSLLIFQSFFSWLTAWFDYYNGYSIVLFSTIYLSAAYFRKYPIVWVEKYSTGLCVATIMVMACLTTFSLWMFGHAARQIRDDNPLVILASVLLLLSFRKFEFQNKVVNWLAASCFSVYLIHYNPYIYPHFMSIIKYIYGHYSGMAYCVMLLLTLCIIYICCVVVDQLRVLVWHWVMFFFNRIRSVSC